MTGKKQTIAERARKLPLMLAAAGLAFGLPTASFAVVSLTGPSADGGSAGIGLFTPASVDPQLARRVAENIGGKGMRFTPAVSTAATKANRTYTVAVRVDDQTARAISVRSAAQKVAAGTPGLGTGIAIAPTKYNLGISRGYQSFAKPITLPDSVRKGAMPDISRFEPAPVAADKPSRFQPRIALEDVDKTGRSEGTIESLGTQTVDLGGAYRVTRNIDVTAGVRLSQERDRLAPLTDSAQDSQAVYVGTQFRF